MSILQVGTTRFVVLLPGVAIKFAKFDLCRIFLRAFQILRAGNAQTHVKKYHGNVQGAASFAIRGILCNLRERRYWKESRSCLVAPTYFSLLGLINIQARCLPLSERDASWVSFISMFSNADIDRWDIRAKNYGMIGDNLVCLDYAKEETYQLLQSLGTNAQFQSIVVAQP